MNTSYTGSSVEEDQKNTENGTWNEYDRIAISDFIYAAKEVCGPIAYNRKGVTAAWLRIAKPAKMKKYPNHTMMGARSCTRPQCHRRGHDWEPLT